ncbi:MAG: hypothetical protein GY953_44000 [bacterium]|nr:hypothetical protein [bacterium]
MPQMDLAERVAKQVVERSVEGAIMHYQADEDAGQHDFDLELSDGTVVPLEVTAAKNQPYEETVAAIRSPHKGGPFVDALECQQSWRVHPTAGARINRIREQVDSYLAKIEAAGLTEFFSWTDASESQVVFDILRDLGIERGRVFRWKRLHQIGIALPFSGMHKVASLDLQLAVEAESRKSDNRKKLGLSPQGESHLFVYIDPFNYTAWKALVDHEPPISGPELPEEITQVWAVGPTRTPNEYVVRRASRSKGWSASSRMEISVPGP